MLGGAYRISELIIGTARGKEVFAYVSTKHSFGKCLNQPKRKKVFLRYRPSDDILKQTNYKVSRINMPPESPAAFGAFY